MGRIGILGGSSAFTGAPYYAALSALKHGADLAYIFCEDMAAIPIKSYSPEPIVLPLLSKGDDRSEEEFLATVGPWLDRCHVLVVGPGLGRELWMMERAESIVSMALRKRKDLVIDADGLFLVAQKPHLLLANRQQENEEHEENEVCEQQRTSSVVLTPNIRELDFLTSAFLPTGDEGKEEEEEEDILRIHRELHRLASITNSTVLLKHRYDFVATPSSDTLHVKEEGAPRRCGGQGDVLAGAVALGLHWARLGDFEEEGRGALAGLFGSVSTRMAARLAFAKHGRSTTTPDILAEIEEAGKELFP